jgi:hypothetical protein
VTVTKEKQQAISAVLASYPGTLRALAREAELDHSLLVRIRSGERAATVETVRGLLNAFAKCKARCEEAEKALRATLQ